MDYSSNSLKSQRSRQTNFSHTQPRNKASPCQIDRCLAQLPRRTHLDTVAILCPSTLQQFRYPADHSIDPGDHKPDLIPGSDGAGIIHSTGPSSSWSNKTGAKVILHDNNWLTGDMRNLTFDSVFGGMSKDGTLQEHIVVDDAAIVEMPAGLSAAEGASLVTAGTTAWAAIRGSLDMRMDGELEAWKGSWTDKRLSGKTVLTMGTGGVSCFGIQVRLISPLPITLHRIPLLAQSHIPDRIRPRRNRNLHLLQRFQALLRQVARRNTYHQLRRDTRLGGRSAQVD